MLKEVKYQWATFLKQLLYRRFFIDKETRSLGYPGQFGVPKIYSWTDLNSFQNSDFLKYKSQVVKNIAIGFEEISW